MKLLLLYGDPLDTHRRSTDRPAVGDPSECKRTHSNYTLHTVVTNINRNDCRLLHSGIFISKKERRRKLFCFNLVITVYTNIHNIHVMISSFGKLREIIFGSFIKLPSMIKTALVCNPKCKYIPGLVHKT